MTPHPFALLAGLALTACSVSPTPPPTPTPKAVARPDGLMVWPDLLTRTRPEPSATIAYGEAATQKIDLWLPAGAGPHPTVLMVHGGCWQTEIADRRIMNWIADDLRGRGIAVWNIDYRGVDRPGGGYPGTFADVWAAVGALALQAERYKLDRNRLVAVGHSAGGHLALWAAAKRRRWAMPPNMTMMPPTTVLEVISLGGLPDLELAERPPGSGCGTDVIGRLVGRGQPRWTPKLYYESPEPRTNPFDDTSVPRMGPLGIPQVLINGAQDRIIPAHFAEDYARKMRAQGDDVRVRFVDRTGHVELIAPESAAWAATVEEIERALGR